MELLMPARLRVAAANLVDFGWQVYLPPMIDCFDGLVVSWTIGTRPDSDLVNTMLDHAIETVAGYANRPLIHPDRGVHYRCLDSTGRCQNVERNGGYSKQQIHPLNPKPTLMLKIFSVVLLINHLRTNRC